jgi:hypothetical protein
MDGWGPVTGRDDGEPGDVMLEGMCCQDELVLGGCPEFNHETPSKSRS